MNGLPGDITGWRCLNHLYCWQSLVTMTASKTQDCRKNTPLHTSHHNKYFNLILSDIILHYCSKTDR